MVEGRSWIQYYGFFHFFSSLCKRGLSISKDRLVTIYRVRYIYIRLVGNSIIKKT